MSTFATRAAAITLCFCVAIPGHCAWGRKSPAQVLQEQRAQQAAQILNTCAQFRRLATEGAPIYPPNANPFLEPTIAYAIKVMIDDERFSRVFGKPYDALTPQEFYYLGREALPYCNHGAQPAPLGDLPQDTRQILIRLFTTVSTFQYQLQAQRSAAKALESAKAQLAALPASSASVADLKRIDALMAREIAWVPGPRADSYRAAYESAQRRILMAAEGAQASRQVSIAGTSADLKALAKAADEAAAKLSATADPVLRATREEQVRTLDAGLAAVSGQLAARELATYQAFMQKPPAVPATLAESKAIENDLSARYGNLLARSEFQKFNETRREHRSRLYAANSAALVADVNGAADAARLDALLRQYVADEDQDSAALAPVRAAIAARRRVIEPFSAFSGGDYLNAVYSGNFDLVRAADVKYLDGYLKLNQRIAQELNSMPGGGRMAAAFESANFSMITPVVTTYLMNYGSTSKACLRPGFREFTITRRLVTTRDSPFGRQIVDDYGIVGVDRYPVNREFIPVFEEVGTSDPDEDFSYSTVIRSGQASELLSNVRAMMAKVPCNDARIARFERNLLGFYKNRDANRQKVIADRAAHLREREQRESAEEHACRADLVTLRIPQSREIEFMKRCRDDRNSITTADIERWTTGSAEVDALREKIYGANPMFSRSESGVRSMRCAAVQTGEGIEVELQGLRCIETYQLTDEDRELIRRSEARIKAEEQQTR